ncbi:MAG: HmuY family protein [Bacteroidota bacterium]
MKSIKSLSILLVSLGLLFVSSCSSDDDSQTTSGQPFVVAFESLSANLNELGATKEIPLVYSESATLSGSVTISLSATNAVYGSDFSTTPAADGNVITLNISPGTSGTNVVFNKLNNNLDETTEIVFTITAINYEAGQIQGNTSFTISNSASLGRALEPSVGGPNQGNQVYIDLSTETQTVVVRDSWDLAFYSGDDFRVGLNASIYMAAANLETTDIDAITEADVADLIPVVAIGTFDPTNEDYIDHPDGDILLTAIDAISENDNDNPVYLVNLGFEVGTEIPDPGSVAIAGDARGWKKIRVLRSGDGYLLQYANLNDTSHQEISIPKTPEYNFNFFSFNTNNTVSVEPKAEQWDINFTVFTNIIDGAGSYGFADGVLHNRKGGVLAYEVLTDQFEYEQFSSGNVNNAAFQQDQRAIGSNWRDVFDGAPLSDRFYVLKDPNGNVYKLKFLALTNDQGVRGYPEFEYELLQ